MLSSSLKANIFFLFQFYLQARFTWQGARLLRPMIQFFVVLLAVYTGLTRISDYRHHPSDVLTGYLQGAFTAYWVVSTSSACLWAARVCPESQFGFVFFCRPFMSLPCLNAPAQTCLPPRHRTASCHLTTPSAKPHTH